MEIKLVQAKAGQLKTKPEVSNLGFGDIFTDHMFMADYEDGKGWLDPRVVPYGNFSIDPAAMAIHYGQEIYEGLKAYRGKDDSIYLFRPDENFKRFNRSAARVWMAQVDRDIFMEGMKSVILQELTDLRLFPSTEPLYLGGLIGYAIQNRIRPA